jgi:hypothetical protein
MPALFEESPGKEKIPDMISDTELEVKWGQFTLVVEV